MITATVILGGTVWEISGGPGFYATLTQNQSTGQLYLTRCQYVQAAQFPASPTEMVIVSDQQTMLTYSGIDVVDEPKRELEAFIRSLYVLGTEFDTNPNTFELHEEMELLGKIQKYPNDQTGLINFYQSIAVFDFMAMTGAILYPFNRLVTGDLTTRPTIQDAPQGDKGVMWGVLRTLGIWGFLVNLLADYGISESEFTEKLIEWLPDQSDRQSWVYSYVLQHLRTKGWRILSSSEVVNLIG